MTVSAALLETSPADLADALQQAHVAVFDFETSGLNPRFAAIAGLGVYLPELDRCFYVNVGHGLVDPRIPRHSLDRLAAAVRPFVENSDRHAVFHNAAFDLRFLIKMELGIRCRVSCTIIHAHRVDENLKGYGKEKTYHYHLDQISYGLKELTTIYFGERPPRLREVTQRNTISSPPADVAEYCAMDVVNTWRLYERCRQVVEGDPALRDLTREIDDPNNIVIAKMLWEGMAIDAEEAGKQLGRYRQAIQACNDRIWKLAGLSARIGTPREIVALLNRLGIDVRSARSEELRDAFDECGDGPDRTILALLLSRTAMEQRCSSFLVPLTTHSRYTAGRLYPNRFSSTLTTTRFSSSPNIQNLPGRADVTADDTWRGLLSPDCCESHGTRNVLAAKDGHLLVSMDLSAAEPRYLAMLFQRALERREADYRARRAQINADRWGSYPVLMDAMRRTQKNSSYQTQEIAWPCYDEDPLWRVFRHGGDPYNALLCAMDPGPRKSVSVN
ncbi:MAG: hypothetical protein ACOCXY_03000 [Planctomycetota bacterium]